MAEKKKVYLDTSVPGAYYDDRSPEQRDITRAFWQSLDRYDVYISTLVKDELEKLGEVYSREIYRLTMKLIRYHTVLSITDETEQLAENYLQNRVVPPTQVADSLHLAIASANSMDYLVSWNFRHLVRHSTRQKVNLINQQQGYASLNIVAPSEFLEGAISMKMKKRESIWKDEDGYHTGKEPAVVKDIHDMRKRYYPKSLHNLVKSILQKERQSKDKKDKDE